MLATTHLTSLARGDRFLWRRYLLDSVLALFGVAGVTAMLFWFHLYPRIPNISIVYLLMILPLATLRGRYCASLAAILTFWAFDFFLVPPLFQFIIYNPDEWIALGVFLIDALLTGYLASTLRQRAQDASRRERETHALYHLLRLTSREEKPEGQVQAMCRAVVEILAPWGVQECALFQLDPAGTLHMQASAAQPSGHARQSRAVQSTRDVSLFPTQSHHHPLLRWVLTGMTCPGWHPSTASPSAHSRHLLSLKLGEQTVGAVQLSVVGDSHALLQEEHLEAEGPDAEHSSFFSTFLNQVAALLERARLQQETLRMEILQRTDTLRAALLSSVSHDLRTPLTAIKATASTLLQRDVQWEEDEQRSFLYTIEHEADRLNRLVANLLDMSRIEEGALKPDKDWYSVTALIQDVVGRLAPLFEGRRVRLHLPDDLLFAEFDYLMIDQVFTNLLENAVRYTPANAPLDIEAKQEGAQVTVSVADRGPGLPAPQLEQIFDKFYRVLHEHSASGGSGLGLTVCRGLIEAHSGCIWAEQRLGGGLIFRVVLPVGDREGIVYDE